MHATRRPTDGYISFSAVVDSTRPVVPVVVVFITAAFFLILYFVLVCRIYIFIIVASGEIIILCRRRTPYMVRKEWKKIKKNN